MRIPPSLIDVNVLVYAVNESSDKFKCAKEALRDRLMQQRALFTWHSISGFLRITTHHGILPSPLPVEAALAIMHRWIEHPGARIVHPGHGHAGILARFLVAAGKGGNLVPDAHLAAIAIEHEAELVSFDKDFLRFAGLRVQVLKAT